MTELHLGLLQSAGQIVVFTLLQHLLYTSILNPFPMTSADYWAELLSLLVSYDNLTVVCASYDQLDNE